MKIHHIGYLVTSIQDTCIEFEALGYTLESGPVFDPNRDIQICFLCKDAVRIELVCPCSEKSVVYSLQKKMGVTPYHICYQVQDLAVTSTLLRDRGYLPMGEVLPAPALNNAPAAFFFHRQMGIIELITID